MSSARALLRIIDDILDSSKIEAGAFELDTVDFDPRRVVDDVVRLLRARGEGQGDHAVRDRRSRRAPTRCAAIPGGCARPWSTWSATR